MSHGRAILLVRNPFVHDARVLRAAHVLRDRGFAPLVVAVMSTTVRRPTEVTEGIPVLRLDPRSPLGLVRRLARRREGGTGGTAAGAPVAVGASGAVVRIHRWLRTLDFYRRAFGVVRRERPVLLQCNDYNTMWVGVLARALLGTAVVYDSHELWADRNGRPEPRWWLLTCEWLFVRVAREVIAASPGYADVLARRYRVPRPEVVLNVPDAGPPPAGAGAVTAEPDVAVYVGGLQPHRGVEQAIDALGAVPGLRLRLIGPGRAPYLDALRERARAAGVADRVELVGPVPAAEVVPALRGCAFGVALFQPMCLSHELVAPNKLFEYASAGLPVLASDLPVLRDFVERYDFGVLVPPGDTAAIARGFEALRDPRVNERLRAGAVAVAGEVTWERERATLERAYERALSARA